MSYRDKSLDFEKVWSKFNRKRLDTDNIAVDDDFDVDDDLDGDYYEKNE